MDGKIVAFDPGGTTGVCILTADQFLVTNSFDTFRAMEGYVQGATLVIAEEPFMSARVNPIVFRVYGVIQFLCWKYQVPLLNQPPSNTKFIQARFKDRNCFTGNDHQKDAKGHLIFWLHNTLGMTYSQITSQEWPDNEFFTKVS